MLPSFIKILENIELDVKDTTLVKVLKIIEECKHEWNNFSKDLTDTTESLKTKREQIIQKSISLLEELKTNIDLVLGEKTLNYRGSKLNIDDLSENFVSSMTSLHKLCDIFERSSDKNYSTYILMKKISENLHRVIKKMEIESRAIDKLINCIKENKNDYLDSDEAFRNLLQALRKTTINNKDISTYRSEIGSLRDHLMASMLFDCI